MAGGVLAVAGEFDSIRDKAVVPRASKNSIDVFLRQFPKLSEFEKEEVLDKAHLGKFGETARIYVNASVRVREPADDPQKLLPRIGDRLHHLELASADASVDVVSSYAEKFSSLADADSGEVLLRPRTALLLGPDPGGSFAFLCGDVDEVLGR